MSEKVDKNYDQELAELKAQIRILSEENSLLKRGSLLVGVVWYGYGSQGLSLTQEILGKRRLELTGYGSEGVIDYPTWRRMANSEVVQEGVLVRDDSVIERLAISGQIAPEDKFKSVNAFTDAEIEVILKEKVSYIKKIFSKVTEGHIFHRAILIGKRIGIKSEIISIFENYYKEWDVRQRYSFMLKWDLIDALDRLGLNWQGKTDSEMREVLIEKELGILNR